MVTGVRSRVETDALQIETQWQDGAGEYVHR
jgi:hypothetical protein